MNYLDEAAGTGDPPVGATDIADSTTDMRSPILGIVKTMRPRQWVKNLFVILPIVFSKGLLDGSRLTEALVAFLAFCAASSAVYVLNDLADVAADRRHPTKRSRPIASGVVSVSAAYAVCGALVVAAACAALSIHWNVALVIAGYLALNVAYTFKLKRIAYVDVLCIASGFELRMLAGMLAVGAEMSTYLVIVTFALASFLGFGKRMHELLQGEGSERQREALKHYSVAPLRVLMGINGVVTVGAYLAATIDPHNVTFFGTTHLAYTTVFTGLGIVRFGWLVSFRPEAESPTEEMLQDRLFLANLVAWFATVVAIVYAGR